MHEVGLYTSCFLRKRNLEWWADRSHMVQCIEDVSLIRLGACKRNERVYHGKESSTKDFFFVYTYLFSQMYVRVTFATFQSDVLCKLNIAPTQLHPNGWTCIHAFVITPSVPIFLHYYHVRPLIKRGWVLLTPWEINGYINHSRILLKGLRRGILI